MSPSSIPLKEIEIVSGDGAPLIKEALQKYLSTIPMNRT